MDHFRVLFFCLVIVTGSDVITGSDVTDDVTMTSSPDAILEAKKRNQILVQGDMIMDSRQYISAYHVDSSMSGFAGAAMAEKKSRWPNGVIPFKIDPKISASTKKNIAWAMSRWSENTCIKFVAMHSPEAQGQFGGINIVPEKGCWAPVGRKYWESKMSLGVGCESAAAHELGHVIGLHHEQCRTDRDQYIKVMMGKVAKNNRYNFEIAKGVSNFSVPYDYCSIMHYGTTAFGMGQQVTIVTKDPDYQLAIGNRGEPTFNDYKVVNLMYECSKTCAPDPSCASPCYTNHECACACPKSTDCRPRPCDDYLDAVKCKFYSENRLCGSRFDCAKSCGVCGAISGLRAKGMV